MSIKQLNPYLMFNGNAEKAIKHYERALGATTEGVQRFSQVPGMKTAPEHANRIIHALLRIGTGVIMVSDSTPEAPVPEVGNVHITLDFDDLSDMTAKFDALAKDGKVTFAIHDTFWGAKFGMLTDAFGINWMFNCAVKQS
jgi:PhnB protein